jgi:hypothetical protein
MENFEIALYVIMGFGGLLTFNDIKEHKKIATERYYVDGHSAEFIKAGMRGYMFVAYPLTIIKNTFFMFLCALGAHMMFVN